MKTMIAANELMIGNWYIDYYSGGKYLKIKGGEDMDNLNNEDEPIPITPEILEKAELKWDFEISFNNDEYDVCIETDEGKLYVVATFKYLHQLQNLYYCLTGEELEIEL